MALRGLERRVGHRARKLPTTTRMLLWIFSQLSMDNPDDALLWFALVFAWFFLMRIGEYAHSGHWDMAKVMTPVDIRLRCEGRTVDLFRDADEVEYHFKRSKADQQGAGETRNHFRASPPLCPLYAGEQMQRHFGHRLRLEPHQPVCRRLNGAPLTRTQIQEALERAAVAEGLPPDRFRSHSLRIGGATALYHIYKDVEIIKRWGRWASTAFHAYLWEGRDDARDVAARMAADRTTLHAGAV